MLYILELENNIKCLEMSFHCRVQEVMAEGLPIVDVDGSYLYRKQQTLLRRGAVLLPLPLPAPPLAGWVLVTDSSVDSVAVSIPNATSGKNSF